VKRFVGITFLAIAAFFAIGSTTSGATRLWTLMALWVAYFTLMGFGVAFIQMNLFARAICRGPRGRMKVALTFDDGPDPASTPVLLDLLKKENIAATFFCIGERVAAHPRIAARIVEEGHLIGNHNYHHYWHTALMGPALLSRDIEMTQKAVEEATGATPRLMRPPIGMTNPHYGKALLRAGLILVGWDVRSLDTRRTPRQAIERVLDQARDGSIILLHDGGISPENVIKVVTDVVHGLRERGLEFERLDRLIECTGYIQDAERQGARRS
jgi:peptidoglycan/xylan/chitin deacetylase (PgdA/CDA1 family)